MPRCRVAVDPRVDPRTEYQDRLAARRLAAAREDRSDRRLSWARGALLLAELVLGWLALRRHLLSPWVLLVPLGGFLAAVVAHDRVARRQAGLARAIRLYERALRRLDGRWDSLPEDGSRFLDPHHPYAADLDLFGSHSLFQLVSTARTAGGEATLANWLTNPAIPPVIRERQGAVEELRPHLDLREQLWIAGHDVRAAVEAERLSAWGSTPALLPWTWMRPLLFALAVMMAAVGIAWMAGLLPAAAPALLAAVILTITLLLGSRSAAVVDAVARPETHLALLAELAQVFEQQFASSDSSSTTDSGPRVPTSPRLRHLHQQLTVDGKSASQQIARLGKLVRVLSWQHNQVFAPIGYALLWRPQFAFAIEAWRRRNGPRIAAWIEALSELEALAALSTLAYDHPERPFPRIEDATAAPIFSAKSLRHPLLPGCVPNDVHLGGAGTAAGPRLIMLSGSNMSGKSTLMRTLGVNAVLALAGAPVAADELTLSPLALGATLRIQDSLVAGTSRFYAEVTRLRQLVDLARGPRPLLFLIDEILAGTNSHDRRLGAASVLRGLVELGALGIASTHDLALTEVVSELPGRAVNYHFQDELREGLLSFDYKLRPGVVQRSNALALMRAVGLDV
ncbi:MAG: DNA mismatch repair protein MutS [Myxococcales bacterium]